MISPYSFEPISVEIARIVEAGGILRVSGTARNPFARPVSPALAAELGFEILEVTPLQSAHAFGAQRTTGGALLNTTNSTTVVYRKLR